MKTTAKILSVILVMTMVVSTFAFAATFSDVTSDKNYYEPVSVLSAFGIINGYEDGTFGPDKNVTRAEFSAMLMRTLGAANMGSPDPAGMPFTDLADASWAVSDIRTAYDLGIINGMSATTFEPNSNVTYEQALKMIVCALNYGAHAEQVQSTAPNQPWYHGYLQTAITLGLVNGVSYVVQQPAKRWEIAQMLYNSFEVKLLEKLEVSGGGVMYQESKETILGSKLGITKSRGEIIADETNTIATDGATARAGFALILDSITGKVVTVAKNNISVAGLLGKAVDYFYKADNYGENTLIHIIAKGGSSSSVKVNASDVNVITGSYSSGYKVEYYPSATATRPQILNVEPSPVISINGKVYSGLTANALMIEAGSLEFIMTDGKYTKINVESLETYVVKSVNSTDKYIVDMFRPTGSNTLYLDDEDPNTVLSIKNSSNSNITLSGIAQYNVLTVRKGQGAAERTSVDVTVSNKNISGVIKSIDTSARTIDISGTEYYLSGYLVNYGSSVLDTINIGDNCKFYLDTEGKVAYALKTASTTTYYGYIAGAANDTKMDSVKIGLVSQKISSVGAPYLYTAKKVKVDGETYTDSETILGLLEEAAKLSTANLDGNGNKYSQLIKYTLNSSGEISSIETALMGENESADDETVFKAFSVNRPADKKMTYKNSSSDFIGASNSDKFRINSNTQVFVIPTDRSEYESYGRKSKSFFKEGIKYIVEPYDVTGTLNVAGAVVVYETEETEATVDHTTPLFLITEINQGYNKDGNEADLVRGYKITTSGTLTADYEIETDRLGVISDDYEIGDVIVFVTNNKGYVKEASIIEAVDVESFAAGSEHLGTEKYNGRNYTAEMVSGLLVGSVLDGTTQMFDLALEDDVEDCETTEDIMSFTTNSTTKYFTYNSTATSREKVTKQDDVLDLESFASYNATKETEEPSAAKIFVYTYGGTPRLVYVIK